jgi:cytochrome c biogenesis protein CcmG, thiol:disulfide interchange protein DsbE
MMRATLLIFMMPIFVFLGFLVLALCGLNLDKLGKPLVSGTGKPIPEISLPMLDGNAHFSNADIKNKKVLINFFASWCLPCLAEHAFITALSEVLNIPVIGIVYKDKDLAIKKYLSAHGNPFTHIALDREGRTAIDWGVTGVPETFLISSEGIILAHSAGPLTPDVWDKLFKEHIVHGDQR